ncbi:MAG: hypothetical protein ACREIF_09425 [Chthoniobacterales bacterium]
MKTNPHSKSAFLRLRSLVGFSLCLAGLALTVFAFEQPARHTEQADGPQRDMPTLRQNIQVEAADLSQLEQYWSDRLTYPTGNFDPAWVRQAAAQHERMAQGVPAGLFPKTSGNKKKTALSTTSFTALGPMPERMTGCSGCYDYTTTEGRINDIVFDPTTTNNGSIVAYAGSVGGGVWKTTNCCGAGTSWSAVTDDPLISTIAIDTLTIDPNDHNTVYAGTGDLNYGSFSMGSQGILKSTDGGNSWTVLGADVFGVSYLQPPGQYPQYNAVGKVRVDPNNSNNVLAGTKQGLYVSNDAGVSWTQCPTNPYSSQRQDITGLELSNIAGSTRVIAAVGTRGFPTAVQYDLGLNGANGIYSATMPPSGCPTFSSIAGNANGFVFGTAVSGSPYTTGANMNAGSGVPCNYPISGGTATYCGGASPSDGGADNLGRIDLAVAPSDPNTIYAQVGSIDWNSASGCGSTNGCQLGAWVSTNGGTSWSFLGGSAGGSLAPCGSGSGSGSAGAGDYPQNWYDQGIKVDPNNPDRAFFDTFEVWLVSRTGTMWYDTTCGYTGVSPKPVHVDQHALAFLPGSSDILLVGNDGGMHGTINASAAALNTTRPTWFNVDTGLNAIEFYSGDISGNFATAATPSAVGGAQDNGPSSVSFAGTPTGPVQWQMGLGGDGFSGLIDPIGTGTSLRYWQGNNSGGLSRCISNCTAGGATWTSKRGAWTGDTQSFVLPLNLFRGGIPGGDDCPPAGTSGGCGHLVAGTTRVWETITGNAASTVTWYVTNNPTTQNLTKQALGNRSYINQVKYSPKFQSVAIVGTNDGNVQIGFNLGTGTQAQATWVDVTGANVVLPNRPILGIALDPSVPAATVPVGYAAIGGFNANTPTTPGHLFQVTCGTSCGSFTWVDKTGNLPDIPADSVIVNPNFPTQVYVGTDWGLYYTNDITAASPVWARFENGLPHSMVWDMQIDRGSTTLSVWTRSRGAYVWPLPSAPLMVAGVVSRMTHGGAGTFDIDLPSDGSGIECRSGGANGDYTLVFSFANSIASCGSPNTGSVSMGPNPNQCTVNVAGVPNAQYMTVTLTGAIDLTGAIGAASGTMGVLIGDTTGDGSVNAGDIGQTKSQSGSTVTASNFREDVTVDGSINAGDIGLVKSKSGTALP